MKFACLDAKKLWIIALASFFHSPLNFAQPNDLAGNAESAHIDVGESYGIYTLTDGLLIQPKWTPYAVFHYENGNFFADTQTGVGYKFLNTANFNAGLSLSYQYGRYENSDSRYRGLGDVSGSAAPSLFAELTAFAGALDIFAEAGQSIGKNRSEYETIDTTIGLPLTKSIDGFFDLLIEGGDGRYGKIFYGVSPEQSINSGYAVYQPGAGLTTITSSVGISFNYSKHWDIVSSIGMAKYIDVAANSPVVDRKQFAIGGLWVSYKF